MIASNALSAVDSYITDVMDGNVVVCKKTRAAVERHLRDLDRQSTPDFPYHFDANHASVAIDYFSLMLCHSIGKFQGLPFALEPWQAFGVAMIHGWKRDHDNSRKYRRVYWSTARKNGKSTWAAGEAMQLASMDVNPDTGNVESVAEVILCATKIEQVKKVIYAELLRMRERSRWVKDASTAINQQITFTHNDGSIRCVGSDKPYDGLNPHVVIKDEVHAWQKHHRGFYDTITTGGGTRSQPLEITVTTAGSNKSEIWQEEYKHLSKVLAGTVVDEALFAWVFEIDEDDDALDEANWIKANPNLGVSVGIDYLKEQAIKAVDDKVALNRFTRYHGNRQVSSTEQAFDMAQWDACVGELSDWKESAAVGAGADLGARDDLAASATVAKFPMGETDEDGKDLYRYEIKCRPYMAEDTTRDLQQNPIAKFIYDGHLRVCKYPIAELRADLIGDCKKQRVGTVAYDPYNGQALGEDLESEGIAIGRMAQNFSSFNEPITTFRQAVKDGRVRHDGNPILRWCIENAVLAIDRRGFVMFDKESSEDKIDIAVAVVMAFWRCEMTPARETGPLFIS